MKKFWIPAFAGMTWLAVATSSHAGLTQYYLEDKIGGGLDAKISVIGEAAEKNQVQQAIYGSIDRARELYDKLTVRNPRSEITELNSKRIKGAYPASAEVVQAIADALAMCKRTKTELFSCHDVAVDSRKNMVKLLANDVRIDLKNLMSGILADTVSDTLTKQGLSNFMIKIDETYVSRGRKMDEPWKFPSSLPGQTKAAKRILYYKAPIEAGGSTWNAGGEGEGDGSLNSVTVYADRGLTAQGLAHAFGKMGMKSAQGAIKKQKNVRVIFIDKNDQVTHVPHRPKITG